MANLRATINMLAPANIISTNITANPTSCIEPCEITVNVTWQNTGDVQGEFIPGIIVDDNSNITLPSEQLDGGQIVIRSFVIPNLIASQHTIQASPNTGTSPQTINIIARGSVSLSSTPSGVQIWIDNADTDLTTPNTISYLIPGSHTYQLKLAGYYDYPPSPETFLITSGQTTVIPAITMELVVGALDITSDPPGADIYIDDSLQEVPTPATIGGLIPGNHTYRLVLTGYKDATGNFDIIDGLSTTISETLISACESATISPSKSTAYIGETIDLTISTVPTTQSFNIEIRDQDDNLIGTCTTSAPDGICIINWDTTDLESGEYNLIVTGLCTSSPVSITLLDTCLLITLASDKTTANIGDSIPLIVNVQPSTQSFDTEVNDQDNNLIGACTTSSLDGTCIINWDTTDITPGDYTLIANVTNEVSGECTSAPITITLQPAIVEAGLAPVVVAGLAAGVIYVALTGQGLIGGELVASGI